MQDRARPREYHRDAASRFRLLADIEPWPHLYRHFRRLASLHEELAAGTETPCVKEEEPLSS